MTELLPASEKFPWALVARLKGQRLKTLGRIQAFKITGLDPYAVYVWPEAGTHSREIPRQALEKAWHRLTFVGAEITRTEMDGLADRQGTYMAGILRQLPGIQALDEQLLLRRVSLTTASKQEPENQFVVTNGLARTYHLKTCPAVPKIAHHHRFEMMRAFAKQSGHAPCSRCKPG